MVSFRNRPVPSSLVRGKWIERKSSCCSAVRILSSLVRGKWIESHLRHHRFCSESVFPREREVDWKKLTETSTNTLICLPSWEGSGLKGFLPDQRGASQQVFPREREVDWKAYCSPQYCRNIWSSLVRGKWIERKACISSAMAMLSSLVRGKWIESSEDALYILVKLTSSLVKGGLVENKDVKTFKIKCD